LGFAIRQLLLDVALLSFVGGSVLHHTRPGDIRPAATIFSLATFLGAAAMRRAAGLLFLLVGVSGCAGDTAALWDPALKDLRGDNQQMRTMHGGNWGSDLPKPTMSADR
jgi:hypothetical protein